MKHRPNRQVSSEEVDLWEEFKAATEREEFEYISVTSLAESVCGIHPTRSRQIVSTWQNEGLVRSGANGSYDRASLTEYGRQVEGIESALSRGESWR